MVPVFDTYLVFVTTYLSEYCCAHAYLRTAYQSDIFFCVWHIFPVVYHIRRIVYRLLYCACGSVWFYVSLFFRITRSRPSTQKASGFISQLSFSHLPQHAIDGTLHKCSSLLPINRSTGNIVRARTHTHEITIRSLHQKKELDLRLLMLFRAFTAVVTIYRR